MDRISRVIGNAFPSVAVLSTELRRMYSGSVDGVPPVFPANRQLSRSQTVHVAFLSYQNTHSPTGNLLRALVKRLVTHVPSATGSKPAASFGGGSGPAAPNYRVRRCSLFPPAAPANADVLLLMT
jgi:hypothetical protein